MRKNTKDLKSLGNNFILIFLHYLNAHMKTILIVGMQRLRIQLWTRNLKQDFLKLVVAHLNKKQNPV